MATVRLRRGSLASQTTPMPPLHPAFSTGDFRLRTLTFAHFVVQFACGKGGQVEILSPIMRSYGDLVRESPVKPMASEKHRGALDFI